MSNGEFLIRDDEDRRIFEKHNVKMGAMRASLNKTTLYFKYYILTNIVFTAGVVFTSTDKLFSEHGWIWALLLIYHIFAVVLGGLAKNNRIAFLTVITSAILIFYSLPFVAITSLNIAFFLNAMNYRNLKREEGYPDFSEWIPIVESKNSPASDAN